jgi:hypothetical protein
MSGLFEGRGKTFQNTGSVTNGRIWNALLSLGRLEGWRKRVERRKGGW